MFLFYIYNKYFVGQFLMLREYTVGMSRVLFIFLP
jgi:hypothetical protein